MIRRTFIALIVILAAGCATRQALRDGDPFPMPLTIELRTITADHRYAYYILDESGTLHFAGGRDAGVKNAAPAGTLTDEQKAQLWRLIDTGKLLDAKGSGPFEEGQNVRYELSITTGSHHASYRAIDDTVPGLADLDAALFKMQGDLRYKTLFKPIDETIRKSGGAVKKE
ncbi:MAG: hypothetical protein GC162_19635 [Planctomycetes bacterium]|nr:hypothetical protein [Planctomycetota bacterium]